MGEPAGSLLQVCYGILVYLSSASSNRHGWTRTSNRQLRRLMHYPLCYVPLLTLLLYQSLGQSSTQGAQILISPPSSLCASLPSGGFSIYLGFFIDSLIMRSYSGVTSSIALSTSRLILLFSFSGSLSINSLRIVCGKYFL